MCQLFRGPLAWVDKPSPSDASVSAAQNIPSPSESSGQVDQFDIVGEPGGAPAGRIKRSSVPVRKPVRRALAAASWPSAHVARKTTAAAVPSVWNATFVVVPTLRLCSTVS